MQGKYKPWHQAQRRGRPVWKHCPGSTSCRVRLEGIASPRCTSSQQNGEYGQPVKETSPSFQAQTPRGLKEGAQGCASGWCGTKRRTTVRRSPRNQHFAAHAAERQDPQQGEDPFAHFPPQPSANHWGGRQGGSPAGGAQARLGGCPHKGPPDWRHAKGCHHSCHAVWTGEAGRNGAWPPQVGSKRSLAASKRPRSAPIRVWRRRTTLSHVALD